VLREGVNRGFRGVNTLFMGCCGQWVVERKLRGYDEILVEAPIETTN